VLAEDGTLLPVVHDILDIVTQHGMILGTGHLGTEEQLALVKAARTRDVKIVVTHADMWIPAEAQVEMARLGAFIEHAYIGCTPLHAYYSHEQVAAAIRAVGPASCILSTDLGQAYNPSPAEGFRVFIATMLRAGFAADEVELMVKRNPGGLLGIV
jgi:predicted metal-dependent phosphotriesterase family hydrolase